MAPTPARSRPLAGVLAVVFAIAALPLAGAVTASAVATTHIGDGPGPSSTVTPYFDGYYEENSALPLGYTTLAEGRYRLGYSLEVRATSSEPDTELRCNFADSNGIIGYLAGEVQRVPADGTLHHLEYTRVFPLPEITVALRCAPSRTGHFTADFRVTSVSVVPLTR